MYMVKCVHPNLSTEKDGAWTSMTDVSPSATILDIFRDTGALESVLELEIVVFGQDDWSCPSWQEEQGWLRFICSCGWSLWDSLKLGYGFPCWQLYWCGGE